MHKYNGVFNYYGEVHNLWTTANNLKEAKKNFMYQLIELLKLDKIKGYRKLRSYFSGKPNYEIKKEVI